MISCKIDWNQSQSSMLLSKVILANKFTNQFPDSGVVTFTIDEILDKEEGEFESGLLGVQLLKICFLGVDGGVSKLLLEIFDAIGDCGGVIVDLVDPNVDCRF